MVVQVGSQADALSPAISLVVGPQHALRQSNPNNQRLARPWHTWYLGLVCLYLTLTRLFEISLEC